MVVGNVKHDLYMMRCDELGACPILQVNGRLDCLGMGAFDVMWFAA
jgi:hypothetical protein